MPYIKQDRRLKLDPEINGLADTLNGHLDSDKGDLNYSITQLVRAYLNAKGISYSTLSDVTGILNDVKTEFERRVVAPYEDEKILQNSDVYVVVMGEKKR